MTMTRTSAAATVGDSTVSVDVYYPDKGIQVSINGTMCRFSAYTSGPGKHTVEDTIAAFKEAVKRL